MFIHLSELLLLGPVRGGPRRSENWCSLMGLFTLYHLCSTEVFSSAKLQLVWSDMENMEQALTHTALMSQTGISGHLYENMQRKVVTGL